MRFRFRSKEPGLTLVCLGVILLTVAVLAPLFAIARYNFLSVDDFEYAQMGGIVWEQTHSVLQVFLHQLSYAKDYYFRWQGTYFSEWMATSLMGLFGKNAYYMGTVFTLGGMVLSEFVLFMKLLRTGLGADWKRALIVTLSVICLQVLLTPVPVEAYFWFCGAILYTFIHALAMLLIALWVSLYADRGPKRKKVLLIVLQVLLLIAVAGSNYITALTMLVGHVVCAAFFVMQKHRLRIWMCVSTVLYLAALLINILAPGNMVRQDSTGVARMSAVKAILLSFKEAGIYVVTNSILPCFILGLLLLPLIVNIVRKKNYRYPLPLLVSIFSFCVFAAQFTPTLYALGITGAGRIQNLYRLNLYVLLVFNEFYWVGWWLRAKGELGEAAACEKKPDGEMTADKSACESEAAESKASEMSAEEKKMSSSARRADSYLLLGWIVGLAALALSLSVWGGSTVTTYSAIQSLRKGEAAQYLAEYEERLEILAGDDRVVELEPFSGKPYLLYFGDITDDPENWENKSMSRYFEKDEIYLVK